MNIATKPECACKEMEISGITTASVGANAVTSYTIDYSSDSLNWVQYKSGQVFESLLNPNDATE